jgi:hypothetical protein
MDIEHFLALLQAPQMTKTDLVQMRKNAIAKNAIEHVHLAEKVLDERYPDWRSPRSRRGGSKPTDVTFLGQSRHFRNEKEAYVWMVERFTQHYPKPFETIDWQTQFIAKGPRTLYFARSLKNLFHTAPDLASDPSMYHRLANGWYAKVNLSEKQKIELLMKIAAVADLSMGDDWDWNDRAKESWQSVNDLLEEVGKPIGGS